MEIFEQVTARERLEMLGWRKVPVDNTQIGETSRQVEPDIRQIFIGAGDIEDQETFERKLYVIRRVIEKEIENGLSEMILVKTILPHSTVRIDVIDGKLQIETQTVTPTTQG